ncbi:hypothetical protein PG997_013671 [Apiospora hydei]|uniref:Uncharacterized protein n=1 Tax=Apiospora hydei TaxID=1337664 RepID=A0ABR1V6V7_9PEZI
MIRQLKTLWVKKNSSIGGVLDTPVAVFKSFWAWFKSYGGQNSEEVVPACFPNEHTTINLEFCRCLAGCHARSNRAEHAETLSAIFHSAIRSLVNIQHNLVMDSASPPLRFLGGKHQYRKALGSVNQERLDSYCSKMGACKPLPISILYKTGDVCIKYRLAGRPDLRAALVLKSIYYQQKQLGGTRTIWNTLWTTIIKRFKD